MNFNALSINGNSYTITKRKAFFGNPFQIEDIGKVFEFAWGMSFGHTGEHRSTRSGGTASRKEGEIFINAFQGKLGEFAVYYKLTALGLKVPEPDLSLWGKGFWDNGDFEIGRLKVNVKSASHFSNLLLFETKDWNFEALSLHSDPPTAYDYFILTRISPDGKSIMRGNSLMLSNTADKEILKKIIVTPDWQYDIPGFMERSDFKEIIALKHIIPQGGLLNGKLKMDASNYYIQAFDLKNIDTINKKLL